MIKLSEIVFAYHHTTCVKSQTKLFIFYVAGLLSFSFVVLRFWRFLPLKGIQ